MKACNLLLLFLITIGSFAQTTWDGTSWSSGTPDNTIDAIITGSYDTSLHGEFTAKNLSVAVTGSIIVQPSTSITVHTNLDNLGSFTIEDKGTLLMIDDSGTVFGNYAVNRDTPDYLTIGWTSFFSSPVIEDDSNITSIFNSSDVIFYWDTSISPTNWIFIPHEESPGVSNKLGLGKGYAVRSDVETGVITRTFTGELNTGDISVPVYYSDSSTSPGQFGYNIVGNPYPSAIDWFAFKDDNSSILSGTMYLWRQQATGGVNHASSYIALNALGVVPYNSANEFIGSAQGFVVKTNSDSNVVFKNSHRVTNNEQFFRSGNRRNTDNNSWLKIEGAGNKSTILVGFHVNATTGFDNDYDGIFIGGTDPLQLYSLNGTDKLLINGLPELVAPNDVSVALGIKSATTGSFTISLEEEFISPDFLIKLEDTQEMIITDLRSIDYTFTVNNTAANESRFVLYYEYDTSLSNDDVQIDENKVKAFFKHDELNIMVNVNRSPSSMSIYDLMGNEILKGAFNSRTLTYGLSSGIYLIELNFKEYGRVYKTVIKQ
ncbi:MAG: T9SS type A sorting domain-containing protein [Flavobacteriaceae bacterium]|nr:T9SS type A sorting domain-containing protein [Flavobacteriaceae bacterium]NNK26989.1 T9SS type A sorting domain-containing protein [Flavobacteriaceae bacterium]